MLKINEDVQFVREQINNINGEFQEISENMRKINEIARKNTTIQIIINRKKNANQTFLKIEAMVGMINGEFYNLD